MVGNAARRVTAAQITHPRHDASIAQASVSRRRARSSSASREHSTVFARDGVLSMLFQFVYLLNTETQTLT